MCACLCALVLPIHECGDDDDDDDEDIELVVSTAALLTAAAAAAARACIVNSVVVRDSYEQDSESVRECSYTRSYLFVSFSYRIYATWELLS